MGIKTALGAMERQFIFFPDKTLVASPANMGLVFEDIHFQTEDGVALHGWYVPGAPSAPLVLFFHGNAGNISHRIENLALLNRMGLNVFIFDYRGYGKSKGIPTEAGTYADGRAALKWLKNKGWQPEKMIYFGRSLGAAAAVDLSLYSKPAGLILESPFTSIAAMGRKHHPILFTLLGWALKADYDNLSKIEKIQSPILIIHGDRDAVTPKEMSMELYEKASHPKKHYIVRGAGHNDVYLVGAQNYLRAWDEFLREIFSKANSK